MFIFYFGCCFASFLMVIAHRLPIGEDFIFSRSKCHHCQKTLAFYELLPLFSILIARFRCRACHKKIPSLYFWMELLYGGLFFMIVSTTSTRLQPVYLIWITMAFLLSLTDLFYWTVEPKILYPMGTLLWFLLFLFDWPFYLATLLFLVSVSLLIHFFLQAYLGFGDALLLLFWGPWLSLNQLFLLLFIASLSALLLTSLLSFVKKERITHVPFVPFLSLGLLYLLFI